MTNDTISLLSAMYEDIKEHALYRIGYIEATEDEEKKREQLNILRRQIPLVRNMEEYKQLGGT